MSPDILEVVYMYLAEISGVKAILSSYLSILLPSFERMCRWDSAQSKGLLKWFLGYLGIPRTSLGIPERIIFLGFLGIP